MRSYHKTGGKKGRPAFRTPATLRYQKALLAREKFIFWKKISKNK
jgi:hypothetical protein